ncbi:MAG: MauE/DoxX family redox-associated membrane protein [Spirillospora sp.]
MQYVALGARCALGLVFLVVVLGKVRSRNAFAEFRSSVPGLAPGLPRTPISVVVVTAELVTVVLLAIESTAPAGLSVQMVASRSVHPGGVLVAVAGGGVLAVIFVFFHELTDVLIAPSQGGSR